MARTHRLHHSLVPSWLGWMISASFFMLIAGILHAVFGYAAIVGQNWYLTEASTPYLLSVAAWGWTFLVGGVSMIVAATMLYSTDIAGHVLGIVLFVGGFFANIAMFSVAPVWSSLAIVINLFVLYAILAYADERSAASRHNL